MKRPHTDDGERGNNRFLSGEGCVISDSGNNDSKESFRRLSAAEHLKEARNALEDGYRVDTDPIKTVWGRLNDANRHIMAIDSEASQYEPAQSLAQVVILRTRQMEDACAKAVRQHMAHQREILANDLEQYFMAKGIDVEISLNGTGKTCLRVCSAVFRAASISRIADETAFFNHLRKVGFTSISFENSEGGVTVYNLESR